MGPNPKYIFQPMILLGGLLILAAILLFLKFKTRKSVSALAPEHKQLFTISIAGAFVLFIVFVSFTLSAKPA